MRSLSGGLMALSLVLALAACGSPDPADAGGIDGAAADRDGATGELDAGDTDAGGDGTDAGMDGSVDSDSGGLDAGPPPIDVGPPVDAGPIPCTPASCDGTTFACGNCLDDDNDGLPDSLDPDCLGACDNNEAGFLLMIPGSETPSCNLDCYFDDNQGSGNDGCSWSSFCDPLNRDGRTSSPDCVPHDPDLLGTSTCPDTQSTDCHDNCDAITPNGCDCFGCCELPARSGNFVFLGGTALNGAPACSAATLNNPDSCHACTPTADCLNECGRCELCLGATLDDLPCDCFAAGTGPARCQTPLDAGPLPDGSTGGVDAGTAVDAGGVDPRCPDGRQACGLPSDPACAADHYCQTGCCTLFN